MSIEDRIKAAATNAEGHLKAAVGDLTGDNQLKAEGEAKQIQASAMNAAADLKDQAKNFIDEVKNAANDVLDSAKKTVD